MSKPLFITTGNHHLFLMVRTRSKGEWIVLLGKRKLHFPFYGTRFDNATFYNVNEKKLHHYADAEMNDLQFEMGSTWKISGQKPFPFSLTLDPAFLSHRSTFLKRAVFDYHLLTVKPLHNSVAGEPLEEGKGFSEQGILSALSLKSWEVPFDYTLILSLDGQSGSLSWQGMPLTKKNFSARLSNLVKKWFLHDQFIWGSFTESATPVQVLAATEIPLGDWILTREIIEIEDLNHPRAFGLKESFKPFESNP